MVQRQSRCDDHVHVVDIIAAAGTYETYVTQVGDECFDIHDYDDDDDDDTDDDTGDDTNDDTDDDADDGGRGNRRLLLDLVLARMSILEEIRT